MNGTECSVTCGIGIREIYRLCNSPQPGLYGNSCVGNSTELVECLREECRGNMNQISNMDLLLNV